MAKQGEPESNAPYRLNDSISDFLRLANTVRATKVLLEVGYAPILFSIGQKIEIDGPDVTDEVTEELVHSVATTRQIRALRNSGAIELMHIYKQHEILVQFLQAFEIYRMDLTPMASIWSKPQE